MDTIKPLVIAIVLLLITLGVAGTYLSGAGRRVRRSTRIFRTAARFTVAVIHVLFFLVRFTLNRSAAFRRRFRSLPPQPTVLGGHEDRPSARRRDWSSFV